MKRYNYTSRCTCQSAETIQQSDPDSSSTFEFGCAEIPTVNFYYDTIEEHKHESAFLSKRFESARTIPGTHKLHSFKPISSEELELRLFSSSEDQRIERTSLSSSAILKFSAIKGYVTARYNSFWLLGCVINTMPDTEEVEINFLHPYGPVKSFSYPRGGDIVVISCHDVLTVVNPSTATERSYTLSQAEIVAASAALAQKT